MAKGVLIVVVVLLLAAVDAAVASLGLALAAAATAVLRLSMTWLVCVLEPAFVFSAVTNASIFVSLVEPTVNESFIGSMPVRSTDAAEAALTTTFLA